MDLFLDSQFYYTHKYYMCILIPVLQSLDDCDFAVILKWLSFSKSRKVSSLFQIWKSSIKIGLFREWRSNFQAQSWRVFSDSCRCAVMEDGPVFWLQVSCVSGAHFLMLVGENVTWSGRQHRKMATSTREEAAAEFAESFSRNTRRYLSTTVL